MRYIQPSPYKIGLIFYFILTAGSTSAVCYFYPQLVVAVVVGLNLGAMGLYFFDKLAANDDQRRTPELILFLATALGLIGGFVGMQLFRHKTKKPAFLGIVGLIALIEIASLLWLLSNYQVTPDFLRP